MIHFNGKIKIIWKIRPKRNEFCHYVWRNYNEGWSTIDNESGLLYVMLNQYLRCQGLGISDNKSDQSQV